MTKPQCACAWGVSLLRAPLRAYRRPFPARRVAACARFGLASATVRRSRVRQGERRPMARADKVAAVAELTDRFRESDSVVLTEYRGLSVAQLRALRESLGENATF